MPKEPRASSATPSSRRAPSIGPAPRTASTTWTAEEDEILMKERAHGSNWGPISAKHFPNKTPNACRKRHERLMERRRDEDWDELKLEHLATQYMDVRREMWGMLANRLGEKFTIVEQKCMEKGVKNLQHLARLAEKRQRDTGLPSNMHPAYDSGAPTPLPSSSSNNTHTLPPSSSSWPLPAPPSGPRHHSLGSLPDDSGIELSACDPDTSDEFSPRTTRSVRGASGSSATLSIPSSSSGSSFPGSRRPSAMMHPPSTLPGGGGGGVGGMPLAPQQTQTPGQSPELVQRGKAGSVGSVGAMWTVLPGQSPSRGQMQAQAVLMPQHQHQHQQHYQQQLQGQQGQHQQQDPMAMPRGSLPGIHTLMSPRPGAPPFTRP